MKIYKIGQSIAIGERQTAVNNVAIDYLSNAISITYANGEYIPQTVLFTDILDSAGLPVGSDKATIQAYLDTEVFNVAAGGGGGSADSKEAKQDVQISLATIANDLLTILSKVSRDKNGVNRSSQKSPRFNSKLTLGKEPEVWDEIVLAGGASVYDTTNSSVSMTVTNSGDAVIRQTKQRVPYQTGAPQSTLYTGAFATPAVGLLQKIGYFNCDGNTPFNTGIDGFWFEMNGLTPELVCSKSGTETFRLAQSNWTDPCDGSGASGANIDFSQSQIFYSSFLWLSVDGIDFGFKVGNDYVICHTLEWKNSNRGAYMTNPNHSIRYEIRSTGGSGTMQQTCNVVNAEDGVSALGTSISIHRSITDGYACTSGQYNPILAVRLKTTALDESYLLRLVDVLSTTNAKASFLITMNPQLRNVTTDISWDSLTEWQDEPHSGLQVAKLDDATNYNLNPSDYGVIIGSGYISDKSNTGGGVIVSQQRIGAKIDQTATDFRDVLVIAVNPQANETFFSSMTFERD